METKRIFIDIMCSNLCGVYSLNAALKLAKLACKNTAASFSAVQQILTLAS